METITHSEKLKRIFLNSIQENTNKLDEFISMGKSNSACDCLKSSLSGLKIYWDQNGKNLEFCDNYIKNFFNFAITNFEYPLKVARKCQSQNHNDLSGLASNLFIYFAGGIVFDKKLDPKTSVKTFRYDNYFSESTLMNYFGEIKCGKFVPSSEIEIIEDLELLKQQVKILSEPFGLNITNTKNKTEELESILEPN